jgi:hypothetical protein
MNDEFSAESAVATQGPASPTQEINPKVGHYKSQTGACLRSLPLHSYEAGLAFLFGGRRLGVLHFAVALREPGANFLGIVFERAIAALVRNLTVFVDDVESLRPRGVSIVGSVGHLVDAEWNGIFEALGEIVGNGDAVVQGLGLHVANVILLFGVGFHAPLVEGMSLADVDGQEIGVILVIIVELNDVANLATKRRSSEAAEDEDERSASGSFADVKVGRAIERDQPSIGSGIAHFQIAAMHVGEGVADHVEGVFRAASHKAEKYVHAHHKSG